MEGLLSTGSTPSSFYFHTIDSYYFDHLILLFSICTYTDHTFFSIFFFASLQKLLWLFLFCTYQQFNCVGLLSCVYACVIFFPGELFSGVNKIKLSGFFSPPPCKNIVFFLHLRFLSAFLAIKSSFSATH